MLSSLVAVLTLFGATPEAVERPSFLFHMDLGPQGKVALHGTRYQPQAGDLVLFDDHNRWTTKLYRCCGTSAPLHAGVVFCRPDGTWGVLEAGPDAAQKVFVFDLDNRLHDFYGTVLIRSLKTPLSSTQSQQLTEFCLAQEGKRYAIGRLILQGTPFRPQGNLRCQWFGGTHLDRQRWMCSELAIAAVTAVGVLDEKTYPANAMYPRDLCYDERYDLSPHYHPAALWYPRAELAHVGAGIRLVNPKER